MSTLYLYTIDNYIHIEFEDLHIKYFGGKNLDSFVNINKFSAGVICVDIKFTDGCIEEDYIDLEDVFSDYGYNVNKLIGEIKEIKIGENKDMKRVRKQIKHSNTTS